MAVADKSLTAPLGIPSFRRLAATYALNELGDWMGIIAVSVLVFDETGSALATAGLFLASRFLPAALAAALEALGQRRRPELVLPVIYCGEAAVFGGLALLSDHFSLPAVIALTAVDGALALTGRSLVRSVVASLLEEQQQLRAGNALLNFAFTGGAAVGPVLAGLVVASGGVRVALLANALSFYVIAWMLLTAGPLPQAEPVAAGMGDRVRAGLAYLRGKIALRRLLIAQSAAFVFFSAVIPVEVVYAKQTLGATDFGYGVMLGSWGAGMVIGALIFAALHRAPLLLLILLSTLAIGAGYLGMAMAPTLAIACVASVLGGAGNGVQWVSAISAVQEMTVPEMQASVMSVLESIGAAMPGLGFAMGGVIATAVSPRATFTVAAAGIFAIALLAVAGLRRAASVLIGPEDLDLQVMAAVSAQSVPPLVEIASASSDRAEEELGLFWFLLALGATVGTSAGFAKHSVTLGLVWGIGGTLCGALAISALFRIPGAKRSIARVMRWIIGR